MANNEQKRSFMQIPYGKGESTYLTKKINWIGLNKRQTLDTGVLSEMQNISSEEMPYLTPAKAHSIYNVDGKYSADNITALGIYGFDDFLIVIYQDDSIIPSKIKIDYITNNGDIYTGILNSLDSNGIEPQRTILKFFKDGAGADNGNKLLIYPDCKSMNFNITANFTPLPITDVPKLKYATVFLSRIFGVDDNLVYASAFGNYADFMYDTTDDIYLCV